ncbi:30S ribosomal protein S16 [Corynebacterium halotolerans]|uniref:Small ribosomal subunit protein bS16 n=1 Tax=Corynebacterium halotolerans YIM 70093 = DSM 44683 TaxID=1121362 RepID=M1NTJ8_9CORY|nr:30S ribosomal protein S16 [Corynebacterium halotolerans]AGF72802.1 30S ribosomal protein S16 [Corynebacterium halotolerans YIM 70093 = DSM 44683]
MAVKIKLQRIGKIRTPHYRVVIADARNRRDGKVIENIGTYEPKQEPSLIQIDSERAQYWLGVGAQPTEPVLALLKVTGDWQKAKGLEGAEGTLKVAAEKPSKLDLFNQALAEANDGPTVEAVTEKRKKAKEEKEAKEATEKAAAEASEEAPAEESAE